MNREELIEYLYENNVHADISIEDLADEITAEPKVGRWIYEECEYLDDETDEGQIFMTGKRWYCSRCGFSKGFRMYIPKEKYCPNCGAKMEGNE